MTKLSEKFTTVTTFSKICALLLFISLPFVGFVLGFNYHKSFSDIKIGELISNLKNSKKLAPVLTQNPKTYNYTSNTQAFSVNVPSDFNVLSASSNTSEFIRAGNTPDDALAWIDTEPANGRTIEEVVKAIIADQGAILDVKSTPVTIDERPAVMLEPLSGQNLIRRVVIINNDTLYQLNFTPNDKKMGVLNEHMESLYNMVIDTFHFTK